MMAPVIYRGISLQSHQWCYGYLVKIADDAWLMPTDRPGTIQVDATSLGQDTGLPDKNGNHIFSGDLLKTKAGHLQVVQFVTGMIDNDPEKVISQFTCFDLASKHYFRFARTDEIVGNIYETPNPSVDSTSQPTSNA